MFGHMSVTVKGKVHHLFFFVVNEGRESLLGDRACEELGLVKRVYRIVPTTNPTSDSMDTIVQNYSDVFKGFGVLPFTYKIQLKEGAQPVVHAARRVPAPLKDCLKKELGRMIMLGVIKKVNEPTDWVNSMVITKKKNGELRICMDPKDLNESIKREHYQIPTREEIISKMSGASYFTKLDASQGFWQLKLDESSTRYCTFNTPFGRYCFLRLPFGIKNKQSREPMVVAEVPTAPWHKVGMDLFHLRGKDYLVVIDYYSNFPEMALLANLSSTCVITHAKSIFARHGIPHTVVSDNGPCFSSKEWQKFAVQYDFNHVTSSPHYAQSNGQAEKGDHILKQLLKKAADSDSDPYLAILSYRASPLQCGLSPAELLMNRKLQTTLPSHPNDKFKQNNPSKIEHKLRQQKLMQKSFYDRTTKHLPPLTANNTVRIGDADGWSTKVTVLQEVAPRSYTVRTDDGQTLRRNRRSLLKTP
ncbi:hypothetical protein N1851_012497 [Merluccius polli]|uniref:ribonuclease H n=1 Tax=Merluccius polli TaxID=89951 RepID=A0AA47MX99_MERPO|nr:hypothetical protein N1851_012497 [Merluccius polli]